MNLIELEEYTQESGIPVDDFFITGQKGMCVKYNGRYRIALNEKLIDGDNDRRLVLAHELAHCETDMLYYIEDLRNPLHNQNVRKAEQAAKKKSYEYLVPVQELKAILKKTKDFYEIVEYFGIPEELAKGAIAYYKRKGFLK